MRNLFLGTLIGTALVLTAAAEASPGDRLRAMMAGRQNGGQGDQAWRTLPAADRTIRYGDDAAQTIAFWPAREAEGPAPLVLFVHGGGWAHGSKENATGKAKVEHFPALGYAFASIDYRLVPQVTVEQEAGDVAAALAALLAQADALGIDRHRVVLMGHSAGAHLVALVGTDERYLRQAGLSFADVAGVIPIDGAAYDVPQQIASVGPYQRRIYDAPFGSDPARQRALSPALQAAAPNAPRFLLLHVQRPDGVAQADELAKALRAAGTSAETGSFPGTGLQGHVEINAKLGDPAYPATALTDRWLKATFGK
ncbi:alpha/beta hydrolase [Novosphingobium sp. EMRT-2]|uniref:alpha/beta hydrolase n=1 Tax=Novosphingobium sp. EMRT-2 TaxID=2571749 RepID=UPI0010BCFB58|nr:alpha/beta hydrolase [Novosphingobium sp. EMRT-2]QCI94602.1 alpha/beta hydrolase [Novosphingobium sp. EMRT-2]